jgi:hypothetical protein
MILPRQEKNSFEKNNGLTLHAERIPPKFQCPCLEFSRHLLGK